LGSVLDFANKGSELDTLFNEAGKLTVDDIAAELNEFTLRKTGEKKDRFRKEDNGGNAAEGKVLAKVEKIKDEKEFPGGAKIYQWLMEEEKFNSRVGVDGFVKNGVGIRADIEGENLEVIQKECKKNLDILQELTQKEIDSFKTLCRQRDELFAKLAVYFGSDTGFNFNQPTTAEKDLKHRQFFFGFFKDKILAAIQAACVVERAAFEKEEKVKAKIRQAQINADEKSAKAKTPTAVAASKSMPPPAPVVPVTLATIAIPPAGSDGTGKDPAAFGVTPGATPFHSAPVSPFVGKDGREESK
jgi:hypothetical protein